MCVLLESPLTN